MLAIACTFGANAQQNSSATEEVTTPPYKFYKGSVATELNFSFFNSTGPFTMPELRLRVGLSNKWALRVNLGIDFGHNKIKKNLDNETENYWGRVITTGERIEKNNYIKFSIAPGAEYHFGKWERLSIYVGGEIPVGFYMTNGTIDIDQTVTTRQYGSWDLISTVTTNSRLTTKNCTSAYICDPWGCDYTYRQNGNMFFGLKAFAGFDFYIYKGLYVGAELGLGYNYSFALKGTVKGEIFTHATSSYSTSIDTEEIDKKFNDKITGGHLGFKCNPMIRLGWRF